MPRFAWSSGTAAIVVDRLIYLVAGALFLFAAAGSARSLGSLPPQLISGAVVVALAILAVSGGVALIAARGQLGRAWNRLLATFAPRRARAPGAWEPSLREMLVGPRRTLLAGLSIHLVSRLLFALEIYAGLRLLGLPSGWRVTAIFAAVPIALSVAGTFIPGQLGLQEGVQALVAAALGFGPAAGLTLVLLQRVRQLLFVPLSGVLIAMVTRGNRGSRKLIARSRPAPGRKLTTRELTSIRTRPDQLPVSGQVGERVVEQRRSGPPRMPIDGVPLAALRRLQRRAAAAERVHERRVHARARRAGIER